MFEINEAAKKQQQQKAEPAAPAIVSKKTLEIYKSTDYVKTIIRRDQIARTAADDFLEFKSLNPTEPGKKVDKPFSSSGEYKGLMHVHLTGDLSLVYKIADGKIYAFGIYSHDDLGTGQPRNINKQRSMGIRFKNATFIKQNS